MSPGAALPGTNPLPELKSRRKNRGKGRKSAKIKMELANFREAREFGKEREEGGSRTLASRPCPMVWG